MGMTFDIIRRGDVIIADLGVPFGSELGHRRPVIVIQNSETIHNSPTLIVAIISGATNNEYSSSRIAISYSDNKPLLTIMLDQLRTIDKSRLVRYIGRLNDDGMAMVSNALRYSLGLMKEDEADG